MTELVQGASYRRDIDGLRALAVLPVVLFHFGYLPNGYLGVDVFFVISGFLITGIINRELEEGRFSISGFYLRRTRRIIPLATFISAVALVTGVASMLPDDLENLAQSVVATNLFSNNILQAITTGNYWDVVNAYKPLMHTWSLGIEEQYYLLYPIIFMLFGKTRRALLLPTIVALATVSLALYLSPFRDFQKFYLIYFRFWELAAGGIAAIVLNNRLIQHKYAGLPVLLLLLVLCLDVSARPKEIALPATVLLTLWILVSSNERSILSSLLLENRLVVAIGKISFGLYMWHQLLLAYARYFLAAELHARHLLAVFALTVVLSVLTYFSIERPFRDGKVVSTSALLLILGAVFLATTGSSFYIYQNAGVMKDIPELGITRSEGKRNLHATYNMRVLAHDGDFTSNDKVRVLVVGDSFARDWANVLLESRYADYLDLSYVSDREIHGKLEARAEKADVIFYSTRTPSAVKRLGLQESKLWVVGTKNFGRTNGFFYNHRGSDYFEQRASMEDGIQEQNDGMRQEWKNRYIDLIEKVIDVRQMVPVFTPSRQFISQDGRHFTRAGASYFAQLFEQDLSTLFREVARVSGREFMGQVQTLPDLGNDLAERKSP